MKMWQRTENRYQDIIYFYSEGYTPKEIQDELGISKPTYFRILKQGGGYPPRARVDHWLNRTAKEEERKKQQ